MKLARFLVMRAPSLSNRVKLYQPFWRPHNTMIEVQGDVVIKDIEDTATFYAGFEHSFQSIKAAHMRAQSCDSLVSHYNVKETTQKKRRANVAATKGLRVVMTRLGCVHSLESMPEEDMKAAVKACLLGCAHLHSTRPKPLCHCDVRLANVLWDPKPFLADLEFAHFSPWQVSSGLIFTDWDEGTLDHANCYTTESDIYQIGVMLLKLPSLSPAGVAFGHKLKTKTVTAAEAAQDTYL
ncbi:TPA: hypothetical protein ACH3X3_013443 [Trebouxia sp. C0006]